MIGMLFALSLITYVLFYALPVDPGRLTCGVHCTPEAIAANRHRLGLDDPFYLQYWSWVKALFVGRDYGTGFVQMHCYAPCLGYSWNQQQMVTSLIASALPVTVYLAIGAFVLWMTVGIFTGVLAARYKGSIFDRGVMAITLVGFSLPSFFIGLFILIFLVVRWQILPYPHYIAPSESFIGFLGSLILPWTTLAILYAAYYTRLTRSQMLDTMNEDYIRTARAKGLAEKIVIRKHAFRAGLTPIVTSAGLDFAGLLGGAIITERIFGMRGLGSVAVRAVGELDLAVLVAVTLLGGTFVVVANLVVDILYAAIDPRVRVK
jgi:peptide/nickel transport system permease protein